MEKFRLEDLKARNDNPDTEEVLIAHKGKVYDVSKSPIWRTGVHMKRHKAGEDLTADMEAAPHGEEVFSKFEPVGELVEEAPAPEMPGGLLGFALDQHPHPVSVHFPVALTMTAAIFTAIGWLFTSSFFITAGFTNLVVALIAMPATIATGYLSFHFNYGHKWTKTFKAKQLLSFTMFGLTLIAVIIHWIAPGNIETPGFWLHAYMFLVFLLAPIVGATGYLGGTITFPR